MTTPQIFGASFKVVHGVGATPDGGFYIMGESDIGQTEFDIPGHYAPGIIANLMALMPKLRTKSPSGEAGVFQAVTVAASPSNQPGYVHLVLSVLPKLDLTFSMPVQMLEEVGQGLLDAAVKAKRMTDQSPLQ